MCMSYFNTLVNCFTQMAIDIIVEAFEGLVLKLGNISLTKEALIDTDFSPFRWEVIDNDS